MRIGIDARFFGTRSKGLGRYTQKLIENLEKVSTKGDVFFVYLRKENWDDYIPKNSNFKKVLADYPWYSFSEQWKMPKLLNSYNLDLVHFPHFNVPLFYRKKFIVTIHDLILLHYPTVKNTTLNPFFYWFKFLAYRVVINFAIKKSSHIIAVSNFTKKDILHNYSVPKEKISVTYEASDDFCQSDQKNETSILKKYAIIKPYILYVGNAYPHKNLEKLAESFRDVLKKIPNLSLVLVGKKDYFYQQLSENIKKKKINNIIFAGFVPDEDLELIYKNAELYIFPSLYEGFGVPPLEAMTKEVPVLSSNHECMREILEDGALYFDANSKEEITKSIVDLLDDNDKKSELVKKGLEIIKKFSWRKMAAETLLIYEKQKCKEK